MNQRVLVAIAASLLAVAGVSSLAAQAVGRNVTVSQIDTEKFLPAVAFNPAHNEFLVVWHNLSGGLRYISGARLDRFGKVLATFDIASGANSRAQPAVAFDNVRDRYLVVWIYDYFGNGSDWDLRGRLVPWNGPSAGLTEFTIWSENDTQWNPRVAYSNGDDEFMVVWSNTAAGAAAYLSFRYVLPDGTPDYASTLAGDGTNNYVNPDIAYSPSRDEYLVGYEINQLDVAVRRMDHMGLLASQVMVANWPDAESGVAVAACPGQDQWLVAWHNSYPEIYARFLYGDGNPNGGPLFVYGTTADNQNPAVACLPGGARYLIAWEEQWAGGVFGISGRVLGADHNFLTPDFVVRPNTTDSLTAAVAGGFLGWSVVWIQDRQGSSYTDVHGAMVWGVFADDLETGNTAMWSAVSP